MRDLKASSNLNSLTIAQLKEELEARGVTDLKKCKLKKDYVEALQQVGRMSLSSARAFRPALLGASAKCAALDNAKFVAE